MKKIKYFIYSAALLLSLQTVASAQSTNISETLKQHFNETVEEVKSTNDADLKREILNESFKKMISALDKIEAKANLTSEDLANLHSYKDNLQQKISELNGQDGFDEILDEDLDDFSDYSQQDMEQANRTLTISLTTALLIIIILLLL